MQPIWLIEANVQGLPSEQLQAAIRRCGLPFRIVKPFLHSAPPHDILGAEDIPPDARIVFTGTLPLMKYIQQHRRWIPGGWCTFDNFDCSTYYSYFGDYLLNRHYTMLPIAEAMRLHRGLISAFGDDGKVFVRPDSVDKSFSGTLVDTDSFRSFLSPWSADPTTMILVAAPRRLTYEWRLFVAHGRVVTGSRYRLNGTTDVAPDLPESVSEFATEVLAAVPWRPDPLFVMDVCASDDGLRIVELNSFSCSGQCACDLDAYVAAASQFAALH